MPNHPVFEHSTNFFELVLFAQSLYKSCQRLMSVRIALLLPIQLYSSSFDINSLESSYVHTTYVVQGLQYTLGRGRTKFLKVSENFVRVHYIYFFIPGS